jgi:NifU-like protein involved in Fe-S cluster formation
MLTVGACLVYQPEISFSIMLKPVSEKSVAEALKITVLILEQAENEGITPFEAMTAFSA